MVEFAAVAGGDHAAHEPLPAEVDLRVTAVAVGAVALGRYVCAGLSNHVNARYVNDAADDDRDDPHERGEVPRRAEPRPEPFAG